jgi:hypothetical protein
MTAARLERRCCLSTFRLASGARFRDFEDPPILLQTKPVKRSPLPSLRAYMLRNQANFVDLSQGEFALAPGMYIPGDGHLNDTGHRQVADAIQRRLQQTPSILE